MSLGRPSLFSWETKEEYIWGGGSYWEEWREGKLWLECIENKKKRKRKASASWKDTQQLGAGIVEDLDLVRSTHMVDYIHL